MAKSKQWKQISVWQPHNAHGMLYTALGLPNQIRQNIFALRFNITIQLINDNFSVNTVPHFWLVIWWLGRVRD